MTAEKPDLEAIKQRNLFVVMVANMTWQLAVVVIVPVVGGHYVDQALKTEPVWTIVGAVIALLGVIGVLINTVKLADRQTKGGRK
ncbi:MAG TPA: AtpZ/AtpI family protein [Candidatus Saccharimonadales bacterium]|nr:AtpZ/AtpI family protein [Candidatus Saccharimonadales bacterium]